MTQLTPEEALETIDALQRDLDKANQRIRQLQQQMLLKDTRYAYYLKYDSMPPTDTEVK